MLLAETLVPLTCEEAATGVSEPSCWTSVAVPPPIAAAAMATAAMRPTPRLARRRVPGPSADGADGADVVTGGAGGPVGGRCPPEGQIVVPGSVTIGCVAYGCVACGSVTSGWAAVCSAVCSAPVGCGPPGVCGAYGGLGGCGG